MMYAVVGLFYLAIIVFMVASQWKVFEKAGQPGWACIVPFYNIYILTKIADKPSWWMAMFFIPIVNVIYGIMMTHAISKAFGKDVGFTLGLIFLGLIFWPILGFGDAQYKNGGNAFRDDNILDSNVV